MKALNDINKNIPVLVPLHPRTKAILDKESISVDFKVIPPVGYLVMPQLIKNSKFVITDSGGLQKDACFFGKKSLILKDLTEWIELVKNNYAILAEYEYSNIIDGYSKISNMITPLNIGLYGDGNSARYCRIYLINK